MDIKNIKCIDKVRNEIALEMKEVKIIKMF